MYSGGKACCRFPSTNSRSFCAESVPWSGGGCYWAVITTSLIFTTPSRSPWAGAIPISTCFIHGKDYGIAHEGGIFFSDDPKQIRLADFEFRLRERFLYEYECRQQTQAVRRSSMPRQKRISVATNTARAGLVRVG
jgi:hypothetical protein